MLKRLELIGPSCLTNAEDDEPLFVLRANDELAPRIVREWVRLYYDSKTVSQGTLTAAQEAKKDEALKCAKAMEAWAGEKRRREKLKK